MLPDSMNVGIIAENIRALQKEVGSIPVDKIPKDFSTDEIEIGLKWIDGNNICYRVISKKFPVITESGTQTVTGLASGLSVISIEGYTNAGSGPSMIQHFTVRYEPGSGDIRIATVTSAYSEADCVLICFYTKPTPVPAQSTKKKTSKKGE